MTDSLGTGVCAFRFDTSYVDGAAAADLSSFVAGMVVEALKLEVSMTLCLKPCCPVPSKQ